VKVSPNWREDPLKVRELDWRYQLEGLASELDGQKNEKTRVQEGPPRVLRLEEAQGFPRLQDQ